ncbi:MAG: hypothetical protein LUG46_05065 [Erysipelotrichaceae bacterium]|nr:hypothetical protein [Erysipelotrichaceae bacterium]
MKQKYLVNNSYLNKNERILGNEQEKNKFIICFSEKLEKEYNFNKLQKSDIKIFQKFLDKVSRMSLMQVEKTYKRRTDKDDYQIIGNIEHEIQHYKINDRFRIHGFIENGQFHVIRLDPNHKVHD